MICFIPGLINTLDKEIWKISLKDLYEKALSAVWNRTVSISIAETGESIDRTDYILYGTYSRKEIYDIQLLENENGVLEYKEVDITDLRIQRIQVLSSGETHAVLNDILVPYGRYSIRFILYHLYQCFSQNISFEAYCSEQERFDERTFKTWLIWMKQHITILRGLGLTNDRKERRQVLKEWVEEMIDGFLEAGKRALRLLKCYLFQRHKMPDHSKRQKIRFSG